MAGFWVVMLPFIFAGIAAITVTAVVVGVIALDWGISLAFIMSSERERQIKYKNRPVAQTIMMIYGILIALIPAGIAGYIIINSENFLDAIAGIAGIAIPFLGFTLPMGAAGIVLFQVFMVIAGLSLAFIGKAERKRLKKLGEKHVVPILMIIYGIIIAAIPICTALFFGGPTWLIGMLSEQAVFLT